MRPKVHRLARKLTTVVRGDRLRCIAQCAQPLQLFADLLARLRAVGIQAQTLSGVLIDDRQNSKPASIRQSLTHKVHAPALVRKSGFWKPDPHLRRTLDPLLRAHLQCFFSIEPVNAFGIYPPTLSPQHYRQSSISVPDPRGGQIPQPHAQFALRIATALITIRPTRDAYQPASAVFTQLIRLSYLAHQLASLGELQVFFESTSCKICLSNVGSATIPFSLRFSSRSCRSSRSSCNPSLAYRRLQL